MVRLFKNKKSRYNKIFLTKRHVVSRIIQFVIILYLSFFITYFAKKEEPLLLGVKQMIVVFILSYIVVLIVKKMILVKNIKMIWIYPLKLKSIVLKIFKNEYIEFLLVALALIFPDLIYNDLKLSEAILLFLFPLLSVNIGFYLMTHILDKKLFFSNVILDIGILFILCFTVLYLMLNMTGHIYFEIFLVILFSIVFSALNKKSFLYKVVYEYSYNSRNFNNTFKSYLKQKNIYLINKLAFLKHKYLYTRELNKLLIDEKFEIKILKSFILSVSCLIFLNRGNYDQNIFFDLTFLLSAINIFSTSSYYNEKFINVLGDILPVDELILFKTKANLYSLLWILISFPYIVVSLFKAKIFWIINFLYILTCFILCSYIGVFVEMSLNKDKPFNDKNIYSRLLVMVIAIIYMGVLKDISIALNFIPNIKAVSFFILNAIIIVLIRRKASDRTCKCYKDI